MWLYKKLNYIIVFRNHSNFFHNIIDSFKNIHVYNAIYMYNIYYILIF